MITGPGAQMNCVHEGDHGHNFSVGHVKLQIAQAPATSRPIMRGLAGPGLLAHVLAFGSFAVLVELALRPPAWLLVARLAG